jgi:hypothetical protein
LKIEVEVDRGVLGQTRYVTIKSPFVWVCGDECLSGFRVREGLARVESRGRIDKLMVDILEAHRRFQVAEAVICWLQRKVFR